LDDFAAVAFGNKGTLAINKLRLYAMAVTEFWVVKNLLV